MPDQIDEDIKADWQADVMELEEEVIFDKNETLKGKELYVFIEGKVLMKMLISAVHTEMHRMLTDIYSSTLMRHL